LSKKYYIIILCFIFILSGVVKPQDKEKVGINQVFSQQGGLYNFGEIDKMNIEVSAWGYIKFPGKYIIPKGSTLVDLISYSGGPTVDAKLENIRLFRPKNDTLNVTEDEMIIIDYNDIFWSDKILRKSNRNMVLKPGDILVFPGEPRLFFRDNISLVLSVSSVLISLAILILSITQKN
jgi:hypothetical protein